MQTVTHHKWQMNGDYVISDPFSLSIQHPPSFTAWPTCNFNWAHGNGEAPLWCWIAQSLCSFVACSHLVRGPGWWHTRQCGLIHTLIYTSQAKWWTHWWQIRNQVLLCLGVVRLWELMQSPSNVSPGYIHCPAGHVTVLMLKNALVNINRPGWQDKFAFMPEEEKTSISLTQKLRHYCSGGHPLKVPKSQS